MDRLLRASAGKIRVEVTDPDGNRVNADAAFDVTVTDGAGVQVAALTVTHPPTQTGIYEATLSPAQLAALDEFTAVWTPTVADVAQTLTTFFETAGGFLFSVADLRGFDSKLADTTKYPTSAIVEAREQAEEDLEDACAVAFVPRACRVTIDGSGLEETLVPGRHLRRLVAVKVDGIALTVVELGDVAVYPDGRLVRTSGVWNTGVRNVELHYEHGHDRPPDRVRRAAMLLARSRLVPDTIPERATSLVTDEGVLAIATPGLRGSVFGIPEVDAAVQQYSERIPVVG